MVNITLVCSAGMSTSMLVSKMQEAAKAKGIEAEIRAMAETAFEKFTGATDILLIGPQIGFLEDEFKAKYADTNMKIAVISMADYGMMNGENALKTALELLH